jgi:hypothetical protein
MATDEIKTNTNLDALLHSWRNRSILLRSSGVSTHSNRDGNRGAMRCTSRSAGCTRAFNSVS